MRQTSWLIIAEAVVCFGLPISYLPFGLLSLLLMLPMALYGEWFAIFNVLLTLIGSLGAFALYLVVRYLVTGKGESFARSWLPVIFASAALLGLWALVTDQFREFEFDFGVVIYALMPTIASIHFLWLVRRRLREGRARQESVELDSKGQGI